MRYYFGPRRIKELLQASAVGRPLTFTYQSGQYLPDWHPWESYKDFYVSKRETGACREIVPFELCWLVDLFGTVTSISCMKDRLGDLEADIDDIYQLLLRFDSKVIGHLMVDVMARPAVRLFRLLGTRGTIEWDHGLYRLRHYDAEAGGWNEQSLAIGTVEPGYVHAEEPYIAEMADFLAAVRRERPWPYPFAEDARILSLLERAESSDKLGRHT
jgi:predicted dehydrogenase